MARINMELLTNKKRRKEKMKIKKPIRKNINIDFENDKFLKEFSKLNEITYTKALNAIIEHFRDFN